MTLAEFKNLVDTLLSYTREAPMTANAHKDALTKAQSILDEYIDLQTKLTAEIAARQVVEDLAQPKAEVMGTEKKVVGWPVSPKKK